MTQQSAEQELLTQFTNAMVATRASLGSSETVFGFAVPLPTGRRDRLAFIGPAGSGFPNTLGQTTHNANTH